MQLCRDKKLKRTGRQSQNPEIYIVLETPNHLFIGKAKDEMDCHSDGKRILVHQLIRQYVIAHILLTLRKYEKELALFSS